MGHFVRYSVRPHEPPLLPGESHLLRWCPESADVSRKFLISPRANQRHGAVGQLVWQAVSGRHRLSIGLSMASGLRNLGLTTMAS